MSFSTAVRYVILAGGVALLFACGTQTSSPAAVTYTIGGTVTGLSGTVVLRNNGGDDLSLSTSGDFTFATALETSAAYSVTVLTQPSTQLCEVSAGSGTVASTDVESVSVTCHARRLFVSNSAANGAVGISGADTLCANDSNKPSGSSTWKAMLVGTTRVACTTAGCGGGTAEHTDWVFAPSMPYIRLDGTAIGTTTSAGVFTFPLTNAIGNVATNVWTGLATNWTNHAQTCANWTDGTVGSNGRMGTDNDPSTSGISQINPACNNTENFYCVEQ